MRSEVEQKINWRKRWLSSINELTSIELQKSSWLDKSNTNPHWSFTEFMCCYFDDLSLDNNYQDQLKISWISEQEFKLIKEWHIALDKYESPTDDDDRESILEDKKWLEIVNLGVIAKQELIKYLNIEELNILTEKIDYRRF